MKTPLFSIIVPVYNSEKYILACLESILTQTSDAYELIVVDDGSTDRSVEMILSKIDGYSNIRLVQNVHGGVCRARNTGISMAKGDYICFVDSDDMIYPDYIASLKNAVQRCEIPDVVYYYTKYGICEFGDYSTIPYEIMQLSRDDIRFLSAAALYHTPEVDLPGGKYHLITSFSAGGQVYKRKLFSDQGIRYEEGVRRSEDGLLNLEILNYVQKGVIIKRELYMYRMDNVSATRSYIPDLISVFQQRDSCVKNVIARLYSAQRDVYMQKYYSSLIYQMRIVAENCIFHPKNPASNAEKYYEFLAFLNQTDYAYALEVCETYYLTPEDRTFLMLAKKKDPSRIANFLHWKMAKGKAHQQLRKMYKSTLGKIIR